MLGQSFNAFYALLAARFFEAPIAMQGDRAVDRGISVAACEQYSAGLQTATLFDQRSVQTRKPLG